MPPVPIVFIKVVFPAPLRPTTPYRRPFRNSSVVSLSSMWPPPYIMRKFSTCTSASESLSSCPDFFSSATPSKTRSIRGPNPKAPMVEPLSFNAFASASGRNSSSMDASASALVLDSTQHEMRTVSTYWRKGEGTTAPAISCVMRSRKSCARMTGRAVAASGCASGVASASPGCPRPKRRPPDAERGSADSKASMVTSLELMSSFKQRSADSARVLSSESFRARRIDKTKVRISALALGPLWSFSFQSNAAMRRTS
mmetsp:Transcript_115016/g.245651  ORF Transcript_115016/g.245651 Transcript_115016/m.245651 type:complete len:256 (+) Transcript_115016:1809-2576(+)